MSPYKASCFRSPVGLSQVLHRPGEEPLCCQRWPFRECVSQAVAVTSDAAFTVPHFSKLQEVKDDAEFVVQSQELT